MDKEKKKAKALAVGLLICGLAIALACFGIAVHLMLLAKSGAPVGRRTAEVCKILVLTGIFFLVVEFGHLIPALLSSRKKAAGADGTGILSEKAMQKALGKYLPEGETLLAGIHAISKETVIKAAFGNCARTENALVPDGGGGVIVRKEKHASYEVYLGITENFLIITECEKNRYFYQFDDIPALSGENVRKVESELPLSDIGKCFPLADIRACKIKKGWLGIVKCLVTMRGGSRFNLLLPQLAGLGGGMPRHAEHRAAIIARLGGL